MKSFLTKIVNPYTITYLVLLLICIVIMLLANFTGGAVFDNDTFFSKFALAMIVPGFGIGFLLDPYTFSLTGIAYTVYQIIGAFILTFFSALAWSLPIWGIIFVVQINPWKRSNKK